MPAINPERRKAFVIAYALTGNGTQSAIRAGCTPRSAAVTASRWLKNPEILSLLKDEIGSQLRGLAPVAIQTMRSLLEHPDTPPATRATVAKEILDRIGFVPPKRTNVSLTLADRSIQDLSRVELEQIASAENE